MKLKDIITEENIVKIENISNTISIINNELSSKMQIPLKNLKKFIIQNQKTFNLFQSAFSNIGKQISEAFKSEKMQSFLKQINEIKEKYPDIIKYNIIKLANYGWFLDITHMEIIEMASYVNYFEKGNFDEMNNVLVKHFEKYLDEIFLNIYEFYPKRRIIIEKALLAHKNRDFELSIPVFLTQIDGICLDVINKEFFLSSKKNKAPKTAEYFNDHTFDRLVDSLLEPFKTKTTIGFSEKDREANNFITVNRHQVLHGEVTDYATEINSYKVISLLNYICSMFIDLNIHNQRGSNIDKVNER